jgi:hypothetical protein
MSVKVAAEVATVSPLQEIKNLNCNPPHPIEIDNVQRLQSQILSIEKAQQMAEFFSLLGDANRLRIVSVLALEELCVCDLAAALNMSESAVSHQFNCEPYEQCDW